MKTKYKKLSSIALILALLAVFAFGVGAAYAQDPVPGEPVSGDGIVPLEYDGNVSCQKLGYSYGFKIEGQGGAAYTGTFPFDRSNGGIHTGGALDDPYNSVTTTSDGYYIDWEATLGIDAVIVKGGQDSNAYVYFPEDTEDTGLASPELDNGNLPAISHVEFCYDYELTASKTANAEFTRTYTWDITKSVDPDAHSGFAGETFSSDYDVVVDQTTADSGFAVSGFIYVNNPTPFPVSFSVTDSVGGTPATLTCDTYTLAPGAMATCSYSASLDSKTDGTNTATITSLTAGVGGATATDDYTFGDPTTVVGYPKVNVTDSIQGSLGSTSGDQTFEYTDDFACPTDPTFYEDGFYEYEVPNRATITETGQYDDANVTVTCYAPVVTKDAEASYDETHTWSIEKSVDPESQSGYPGDVLDWTWKVNVSETAADSNFAVTGKIYVKNPADKSMTVSVADALNDGTTAAVDCGGGTTSLTVAAGETGECTYSAAPMGKTATKNTATATLNGASFNGYADVNFVKNVIGGTATVTDTQIGLNEKLTAGFGPWSFTKSYSHTCSSSYADYGEDGMYSGSEDNTATVTASNGQTDSDDAETTYTCEAGTVDLLKLTNGLQDPDMVWNFALYLGPDGFGTTPIATDSTPPALMDFGMPALRPDKTYTVCESSVMAGWSSEWQLDGNIVNPYNPDADNNPSEDLGNRCFDFTVTVGTTAHFQVDNRAPGGDPRTPGYWKNWSSCTGGGQYAKTIPANDPDNDFISLDEVLTYPGIKWDDILVDTKIVTFSQCDEAVGILDQRIIVFDSNNVVEGKKLASDAARTLAMHLLAAQLNFGAGACTTQEVLDKALEAETLLDKLNFDGTKTSAYLTSKSADYAYALKLAKYLDEYNNGMYCGSLVP